MVACHGHLGRDFHGLEARATIHQPTGDGAPAPPRREMIEGPAVSIARRRLECD